MSDPQQMRDDVAALVEPNGLLDRLATLVTESDPQDHAGTYRRPATRSAAPWQDDSASVLYTIHAEARTLEAELSVVRRLPHRERGGSHCNTKLALERIVTLAADAPQRLAQDAAAAISKWRRLAQSVRDIDELQPG